MTKKKKQVEKTELEKEIIEVQGTGDDILDATIEEKVNKFIGFFWKSTTHITGFGTVNGKATREQLIAFISNINPETDLNDWLSETDTWTEAVKKMRKKVPTQQ